MLAMEYQAVVTCPGFALGIRADGDEVLGLEYLPAQPELPAVNPLAAEVARQVRAYLIDPRFVFGLPLRPQGTPFQRRVWRAIEEIGSGEVLTYGEVAARLRSGPRAVGGACGANPYPLVVPCHRVVAAGGLGGFGGVGGRGAELSLLLRIKRWLLAHEGRAFP